MNIFLKWSGLVSIIVMVSTLLIALTMMWSPDWMSKDVTPLSQRLTQIVGLAGIILGIVGGPLMIALGHWEATPMFFRGASIVAFILGAIAAFRMF
ncbi:MAG: hypothetical protein ACRBF0_19595 [Calditrichia bacterium]